MRIRYTGIAAVVTLWTTLGAASSLTSFDLLGPLPLSYLGTDPGSALLFSGGLLLAAVLLAVFHHWARAAYGLSTAFSVAMLVGLAGQVVAAVVPIGGDAGAHRVHTVSALILGASLPLLMWRFAAGQPPGRWRRASYSLFGIEATACLVGFALSALAVAPLAEIVPAAAFHLWIFAVTLWGARFARHRGPVEIRSILDRHEPLTERAHLQPSPSSP